MNAARALIVAGAAVACARAPDVDVSERVTMPVASVASAVPFGPPRAPDVGDLTDDQRAELRRLVRDLERDARTAGFCGTVFIALAAEIERHGEAGWTYASQVTKRPRTVSQARAFAIEAIRIPRGAR